MFRFTRISKLRKQLRDTVAFIHKRIRIDRDLMTAKEIASLHTACDEAMVDFGTKSLDELRDALTAHGYGSALEGTSDEDEGEGDEESE